MKRSLFKISLYNTILVGMLSTVSMEAQICPDPGCFAFEVTALYMKPVLEIPYYTMTTTINSDPTQTLLGTRQANELDFHGGYTLGGTYTFCNLPLNVCLRWTHLHDSAQNDAGSIADLEGARFTTVQGGGVIPVIPILPTHAHSDINFTYNAADFLIGYFHEHSCSRFSFHAGIQYAYIKYDEIDSFLFPTGNPITSLGEWSLMMQGAGPKIGCLGTYLLPEYCWLPQLYINGKVQFGTVVSKVTSDSSYNWPNDNGYDFSNEHTYRLVPFWDVALGLSSQCYFHSLLLEVALGYEFIHYHKALDGIQTLIIPSIDPTIDLFTDVVIQGLYFSVGITY